MQCSIANKLIRKIFTPNQILPQLENKEKMYILKTGKLQIMTNKTNGIKRKSEKELRVIENN